MIPVTQEITTGGEGDCLSACFASLLELEISAVPKFRRDHGARMMMPAARRWLAENFGLSLIKISPKSKVRGPGSEASPDLDNEEPGERDAGKNIFERIIPAFGRPSFDQEGELSPLDLAGDRLCIAVGEPAQPGGLPHAVVGRVVNGRFDMLHDPHPARRGISGDPTAFYFLVDQFRFGDSQIAVCSSRRVTV